MRNPKPALLVACILAVITISLVVSASAFAVPDLSGRAIVVFHPSFANEHAQAGLLRAFGAEVLQPLSLVNGAAVVLPPGAARQLLARGEVARIDPDVEVHALVRPAEGAGAQAQPPQELPWGVNRIDAEWAWPFSTGYGINVAVIDTGIDSRHPDLAGAVVGGVNFVRASFRRPVDPNKWADDNGHGTHVAGIIAARNNSIGVVGVAPQASLWAVKVLAKNGSGYLSDVISGIQYCATRGIAVANMSLSTNTDVQSLHDACDLAAAMGLILVAAAGNDGAAVDYPAAYSSVTAVAATDIRDVRASWSSYGPEVDVAAPGVSIKSTWPGGGYALLSGTSMAAPHVTGAIALNLSADILASADPLGATVPSIYTGWGLVDAGEVATGIVNYGDNLP